MFFFVLFAIFFLPSSIQLPSYNRIIGGRNADISEFPFIARSFYRGHPWCGNVIINEWTLISAAHCYEDLNASDFKILAGETDVRNNATAIQVREVIYYSVPRSSLFMDDIVVLKLEDKLPQWSEKVQPAVLPPADFHPADGTRLDVTGWGDLYYQSGAQSYILKTTYLHAITNERCAQRWGAKINDGHICAVGEVGRNSCNGDSGGPLSYGRIVLGLVSFGDACDHSVKGILGCRAWGAVRHLPGSTPAAGTPKCRAVPKSAKCPPARPICECRGISSAPGPAPGNAVLRASSISRCQTLK